MFKNCPALANCCKRPLRLFFKLDINMDLATGHAVANALGAVGIGLMIWLVLDVLRNGKNAPRTESKRQEIGVGPERPLN
jgi:hypothetical protein